MFDLFRRWSRSCLDLLRSLALEPGDRPGTFRPTAPEILEPRKLLSGVTGTNPGDVVYISGSAVIDVNPTTAHQFTLLNNWKSLNDVATSFDDSIYVAGQPTATAQDGIYKLGTTPGDYKLLAADHADRVAVDDEGDVFGLAIGKHQYGVGADEIVEVSGATGQVTTQALNVDDYAYDIAVSADGTVYLNGHDHLGGQYGNGTNGIFVESGGVLTLVSPIPLSTTNELEVDSNGDIFGINYTSGNYGVLNDNIYEIAAGSTSPVVKAHETNDFFQDIALANDGGIDVATSTGIDHLGLTGKVTSVSKTIKSATELSVLPVPKLGGLGNTVTATETVKSGGTVATFSDPVGPTASSSYSATVSWGDGSSAAPATISGPNAAGIFSVSGSHTYADEGSDKVSVTVHTANVAAITISGAADVVGAPLTTTGQTFTGAAGATVTGTIATFHDTGPQDPVADYNATVDWGDGFNTPGSITAAAGGGFAVTGTHVYNTQGTHSIAVTIDDSGNANNTAHSTAIISDKALVATHSAIFAEAGTAFNGSVATFTDPGGPQAATNYSATISWGDGSSATVGTVVGPDSTGAFTVTGAHTYANFGTETATVTIHHNSVSGNFTVQDTVAVSNGLPTYTSALLKDINTTGAGSNPANLVTVGTEAYFTAFDGQALGLWKSNGSGTGTSLITHLPSDSYVTNIAALSGTTYFIEEVVAGQTLTLSLWEIGSTATTPTKVADISGNYISDFVALGSKLWFTVNSTQGTAVWSSGGSSSNTALVHQFSEIGSVSPFVNLNGTIVFSVTGASGYELWKSNSSGTTQIASYLEGGNPVLFGSSVYFDAYDATNAGALWKTNGTTTTKVESLANTSNSNLTVAGSALFYVATQSDVFVTYNLMRTTGNGTSSEVSTFDYNPTNFAAVGSKLYFVDSSSLYAVNADGTNLASLSDNLYYSSSLFSYSVKAAGSIVYFLTSDGANGIGLRETDGIAADTKLVRDFASAPTLFGSSGSTLYFSANDGVHGTELWSATGATAAMVKDINTADAGSNPGTGLGAVGMDINGTMYFAANSGSPSADDLWKTNGTPTGTMRVAAGVVAVPYIAYGDDDPTALYDVNSHIVFESSSSASAGANELWTSNGTAGGTGPLIKSGGSLTEAGNTWFIVTGSGASTSLWTTNGTTAGTTQVLPSGGPANIYGSPVDLNGKLYFLTDDAGDIQLWTSDGTAGATFAVKDLGNPGTTSYPFLQIDGGHILISVNGTESWISDGTTDGTVPLSSSIGTGALLPVKGGFVFAVNGANGSTTDDQLWFTDLTSAGTKKLVDFTVAANSQIGFQTVFGNEVLFSTSTSATSYTLWETDGTAQGTVSLGTFSSYPNLSAFDTATYIGKLYFAFSDGTHGAQLWVTDGTKSGTKPITDINATEATGGLDPVGITVVNGFLFFGGNDGVHGNEPWISDGTAAGTKMIADINPGSFGSDPYDFTAFGSQVMFVANDGAHGDEPWILTPNLEALSGATLSLTAGTAFTGTLTKFIDPNGAAALANYSATVEWGDGTTTAATISSPDTHGVFTVTGSHTYASASPETITVVLQKSGSAAITINDAASLVAAKDAVFSRLGG